MGVTAVAKARIQVEVGGVDQSQAKLGAFVTSLDRGFKSAQRSAGKVGKDFQKAIADAQTAYSASARGIGPSIKKFAVEVTANVKVLKGHLTEIHSGLQLIKGAAAAASGVLEGLVGKPARLAIDFERGIAAIRTLGPLPADFERQILDLARRVPQTAGDIAKAAYDAISSGIDRADVPRFLEAASKAAIGGQVDLTTATNALAASLNAYKAQGLDATRAADVLFQTVNKGVITFQDIAGAQGRALATAANLGVSFEELNAAVATLTLKGVKPEAAYDRINSALKTLSATTGITQAAAKRYNVELGVSALQTKGLLGVLEDLHKQTRGSAAAIANMTDRQEAQQGLTILLGENLKTYRDNLASIQEAAGAASRATDVMEATTSGLIDLFKAEFEGLLIEVGKQLLPTLRLALLNLREALAGERGKAIITTLAGLGRLVLDLAEKLTRAALKAADFLAAFAPVKTLGRLQGILSGTGDASLQAAKDLGVLGGAFENIVKRTGELQVSLTTTVKLFALQAEVTRAATVFQKAAEGGVFSAVQMAEAGAALQRASIELKSAFTVAEAESRAFRQEQQRQQAIADAAAERAIDEAEKAAAKAKAAREAAARQRAADIKATEQAIAAATLVIMEDATERQVEEIRRRYDQQIQIARRAGVETVLLERARQVEIDRILTAASESNLKKIKSWFDTRVGIFREAGRQAALEEQRLGELRNEGIQDPTERAIAQLTARKNAELLAVNETFKNQQNAAQARVLIETNAEAEIARVREEGRRFYIEGLKAQVDEAQASTDTLFASLRSLSGGAQAFEKARLIAGGFFYAAKAIGYGAEAAHAFGTGNLLGGLKIGAAAVQAAASAKAHFRGAAALKGPGSGGSVPSVGQGGGGTLPQSRTRADFGINSTGGSAGPPVKFSMVFPVGDGGFLTRRDAEEGGRRVAEYTRRYMAGGTR